MRTQLAPDLFQFAQDLSAIIQNKTPIKQALAFRLGRSYGLKIKTMAGMVKSSENYVYRTLRLLELPMGGTITIAPGPTLPQSVPLDESVIR